MTEQKNNPPAPISTFDASRKKCPTCGKPAHADFRPFCSKRCADVDLNRWFTGAYAVPSQDDDPDSDAIKDADEA